MANVQKYKMPAIPHMCSHYGRQQGEDIRRGNEKINKELTHLNYDLHTGARADGTDSKVTEQLRNQMTAFIKKRLGEVKHETLGGKNAERINIMCDWVVTLPDNVPKEKADEFFKNTYEFACQRYGKENIISAWVHMDETSPHIHIAFIPVVKDKDGSEKLCCREVITPLELKKFHPDLQKYLEEKMEQDVAILNGATAGGNLTIIELKMREALKNLAEVEAKTGGLETAQPIIEDTMKMMSEVSDIFRQLDTALKSKKWLGDDDKAKMEALKKELDEIKAAAEKASNTAATLQKTLQGLGDNVNNHLDGIFVKLREMEKAAQKRIKRTERKLSRREERVRQKEQDIDGQIEQGVQKALEKLDKPIKAKKAEAAALDEEIRRKKQQLSALDTDFFAGEEYLRQAKSNQQNFNQIVQEWSDQNESKIHRPAISKA